MKYKDLMEATKTLPETRIFTWIRFGAWFVGIALLSLIFIQQQIVDTSTQTSSQVEDKVIVQVERLSEVTNSKLDHLSGKLRGIDNIITDVKVEQSKQTERITDIGEDVTVIKIQQSRVEGKIEMNSKSIEGNAKIIEKCDDRIRYHIGIDKCTEKCGNQ